jgi:hypothetical protein
VHTATITGLRREDIMVELVGTDPQQRAARREPALDDLDDAHAIVWQAIRHLFPGRAMVDQTDYGCLLVSWTLRGARPGSRHFAAPVIIRIETGLLLALWTCDAASRADIADLVAADVAEALQSYDPRSREPRCGVILLGV